MKTYIKPDMMREFKDHVLELVTPTDDTELIHYRMRKPGTGIFLVHIIYAAKRIILSGDICVGGHNGCISDVGYDLGWFVNASSESYLCEKFLQKVWQWECAKEGIKYLLEDEDYIEDEKQRQELQEILDNYYYWKYCEASEWEFADALHDINSDLTDDGIPGYDYLRADAGWLCAIRKRFAELRKERNK